MEPGTHTFETHETGEASRKADVEGEKSERQVRIREFCMVGSMETQQGRAHMHHALLMGARNPPSMLVDQLHPAQKSTDKKKHFLL